MDSMFTQVRQVMGSNGVSPKDYGIRIKSTIQDILDEHGISVVNYATPYRNGGIEINFILSEGWSIVPKTNQTISEQVHIQNRPHGAAFDEAVRDLLSIPHVNRVSFQDLSNQMIYRDKRDLAKNEEGGSYFRQGLKKNLIPDKPQDFPRDKNGPSDFREPYKGRHGDAVSQMDADKYLSAEGIKWDKKKPFVYSGEVEYYSNGKLVAIFKENDAVVEIVESSDIKEESDQIGYYVVNGNDQEVAGPFDDFESAKREQEKLGGDARGMNVVYVSDYDIKAAKK